MGGLSDNDNVEYLMRYELKVAIQMELELRKLYTYRLNLRLWLQLTIFTTGILLVVAFYFLIQYINYTWLSGQCQLESSLPMGNVWYTEWWVVNTSFTFSKFSQTNYSYGFEQTCYYNPKIGDIPILSPISPKQQGYKTTLDICLGIIGGLAILTARWIYIYILVSRRIRRLEMTQDLIEAIS